MTKPLFFLVTGLMLAGCEQEEPEVTLSWKDAAMEQDIAKANAKSDARYEDAVAAERALKECRVRWRVANEDIYEMNTKLTADPSTWADLEQQQRFLDAIIERLELTKEMTSKAKDYSEISYALEGSDLLKAEIALEIRLVRTEELYWELRRKILRGDSLDETELANYRRLNAEKNQYRIRLDELLASRAES